jgi:predicted dehydrogenase
MGYDLRLSSNHVLTHARAFSAHPDFRLVGAVDSDPQRRELFARHYKCQAFQNIESAARDVEADLVVLAVPTNLHLPVLQTVLRELTPKAVLCEKPLAYDAADARRIVALCADRGADLFVNYMRRSDPGAIEVKRMMDSRVIHPPLRGVAWYTKGLIHNGSHFVNLLEYWLGPIRDCGVLPGASEEGFGEDATVDVSLTFQHATVLLVAARDASFTYHNIELIASNGRLRYEDGGRRILWQGSCDNPLFAGHKELGAIEDIPSGMSRYQWHVADQLSRAMNNNDAAICSGQQALNTLEAITSLKGRHA